ncbi:MAG: hypothetical protein HGB22_07890 [Chlorobiaceae bacterium]|nr:hypothetical protein [Chlorobiaceae bacterium]
METRSVNLLGQISGFADGLTEEILEESLKKASMKEDEKKKIRDNYKKMQAELLTVRQECRQYLGTQRDEIDKRLTRFIELLKGGPEIKDELVRQYALVCIEAAKIKCYDDKLKGKLAKIVPKVLMPEILPAFKNGREPSEAEWPKYSLDDIYREKVYKDNELLTSVYNNILKVSIETATAELKEEKKNLESIARALESAVQLFALAGRILGAVA